MAIDRGAMGEKSSAFSPKYYSLHQGTKHMANATLSYILLKIYTVP
ncbi:hypothetical protein Aasi_1861 [Candidatus Amoebophilus asiaticus 5a2]|uniref:Uncharacterized protein n=1 Tax=Amoebophilus asiaticus (strain 5a2) TaxID=452471 RepID=C3L458_AMOA5|nr:hypothetical protein Aasi_1861 [Candidatus Amoebophilus asiaticus 5a2]